MTITRPKKQNRVDILHHHVSCILVFNLHEVELFPSCELGPHLFTLKNLFCHQKFGSNILKSHLHSNIVKCQ